MEFKNVYEDAARADAYAKLEFPGTYYLAYRDLPGIIFEHVRGNEALDFGCGTGRSTRFLRRLGFTAVGVDISQEMLQRARGSDPSGDYRLGGLSEFSDRTFDLILSAFTFDNIPTMENKTEVLTAMRRVLKEDGKLINLVSAPEIYRHEWASFSTRHFPENRLAKSGDRVRIVVTDLDDKRPVEDVIWLEEDYRTLFGKAGLEVVGVYKPLGHEHEPYQWVNETTIPPWVIYVLGKSGS